MLKAIRTAAAEQDLESIGWQIAFGENRPDVARQILQALVQQCDEIAALAGNSRLGTAADELGPGVRLFSWRRWVIIFRYSGEGIVVLRIADGAQDYLSWTLGGC